MAAIFLRRKSTVKASKPLPLILCTSPFCDRRGFQEGREGTIAREGLYEAKQDLAMTYDVGKEGSVRGVEAEDLKDEGPFQAAQESIHELTDDEEEKEGPNKPHRFQGEDSVEDLRSKAAGYDKKDDD